MRCGMRSRTYSSPYPFNSEDKHAVHVLHVLRVVTLSVCYAGCFSSLLQYAPPMVGEAAVFLLSYLNDSVNSGEYTRTSSHWVSDYCSLWLVAGNVQVHDLEIEKIVECNEKDGNREPCACAGYDEEELFFFHQTTAWDV